MLDGRLKAWPQTTIMISSSFNCKSCIDVFNNKISLLQCLLVGRYIQRPRLHILEPIILEVLFENLLTGNENFSSL